MNTDILASILPLAVTGGIIMSALASIAVLIRTFLNRRQSNSAVLGRIEEIEASMRNDAHRIDVQLIQTRHGLSPRRAKAVVADLSSVAYDLQKRTLEIQDILEELREESSDHRSMDDAKRIASLGVKVGQTESHIDTILRKIEKERVSLEDHETPFVSDKG